MVCSLCRHTPFSCSQNIPSEFWNANIVREGHKIKACLTVHHGTWDVLIVKKSSVYKAVGILLFEITI